MENDSLHRYANNSMLENICNEKDISLLNLILGKESEHLDTLEEKKGNLDFGPKIRPQELPELFSEVKTEVDKFLGITEICPCKIGYASLSNPEIKKDLSITTLILLPTMSVISSSIMQIINDSIQRENLMILTATAAIGLTLPILHFEYKLIKNDSPCYEPSKKRIFLEKSPRSTLIPIIAHEYTHHIENSIISYDDNKKLGALLEGLATGVERHIAQLYCTRKGNEAFLYRTITNTKNKLIESKDYLTKRHYNKLPGKTKLDKYNLGTAYFMLEESKRGPEIYKETFNELADAKKF